MTGITTRYETAKGHLTKRITGAQLNGKLVFHTVWALNGKPISAKTGRELMGTAK